MPDIVHVQYAQTGASAQANVFGMREMQAKAYAERTAQYLLIKAPPASGKSRALMFIALDKLMNQGIKKVIVAVPERSIGSSFRPTNLTINGFFKDWSPKDAYNLCTPSSDGSKSKVESFKNFMQNDEQLLICTHATLRFAYEQLEDTVFNNTLLAIDEFHHVSADADNILGELLRGLMAKSTAHIVAMTGSYFRGDTTPVLTPENEAKFTKVTYNYYQQLNGYRHLKSLGIGYHFYQGKYLSAIPFCEHALTVGYRGSLTEIIQIIGRCTRDSAHKSHAQFTNLIAQPDAADDLVKQSVNNMLKAITASLLMEQVLAPNFKFRAKLSDEDKAQAGEIKVKGFKMPSSTQVRAIIATDLTDLKASILQNNTVLKTLSGTIDPEVVNKVLIPTIIKEKYPKLNAEEVEEVRQYVVLDSVVKNNLMIDVAELKQAIQKDATFLKAIAANTPKSQIELDLMPKIVKTLYPSLTSTEADSFSKMMVEQPKATPNGVQASDKRFIRLAGQFVNIDDLHIDLIDQVNPFQKAFEVLSKSVTPKVLKIIQETIEATRIVVSEAEAVIAWPKIKTFRATHGREPNLNSTDALEKRMAEILIYIKDQKRKKAAHG